MRHNFAISFQGMKSALMMLAFMAIGSSADKVIRVGNRRGNGNSFNSFNRPRQGRDGHLTPTGGIDFSNCKTDPATGFCCVDVEESVKTLKRDPILECTHKQVEKCHYTYVTQFTPTAEEICSENFEKICQITFKQEATEEEVEKCYKPLIKKCDGRGEEICQTLFESSCTTRYIEKQPGKFVGDTKCEKQPVDICGKGCTTTEGPEECHIKTVVSLIDIPEEVCDLNPQKTCKFQTKLVPKLKPEHECTIIPQEVCNLKFSNPEQIDAPLKTKWCQDPSPPTPGETYSETKAEAPLADYSPGSANLPPPVAPQAFSSQGAPQAFSGQGSSFSFPEQPQVITTNSGFSSSTQNGFTNEVPVFNQQTSNEPRQGRRRRPNGRRGRPRSQQQQSQFTDPQSRSRRLVDISEDEDEDMKEVPMISEVKEEDDTISVSKTGGEKRMTKIEKSMAKILESLY